MQRVFPTVFLAATLFAAPLHAGFVLDDFDDPAVTVSPEMHEDIVTTLNVGILSAKRELRIASAAGLPERPIARLDANGTVVNGLFADLKDLNATIVNPLFAFQFNYIFSPADVSQAGTNDSILFDFLSIAGSESPAFLRAIVTDDTSVGDRFKARINELPTTSGPLTIAMPFSSFTFRGGGSGLPDFTTFKRIDFDFFFFNPNPEVEWTAELARIRFGRVPEPSSVFLFFLGWVYSTSCCFHCHNDGSKPLAIRRIL